MQLQLCLVPLLATVVYKSLIPNRYLVDLGLIYLPFEPEGLEDGDRLVFSLHPHSVDFATYDPGDACLGGLTDNNISPVLLCDAFEARAQVHGVAHDGVGLADLRSHVADPHRARVDADADLECQPTLCLESLVECLGFLLHIERCQHRIPCM